MKLELKHLAPYLPYNLKCKFEKNVIPKRRINTLISLLNINNIPCANLIHRLNEVKPILRPLSDLTKVEENGINEHSINLLIEEKYNLDYGVFSHYKGQLDIELDGDSYLRYDANKCIPLNACIDIYNKLLEGHYDIFGLIPAGLAIDKSTING